MNNEVGAQAAPPELNELGLRIQSQARNVDALLLGAIRYVDDLAQEPRGTTITAGHQHTIQVVDLLLALAVKAVSEIEGQGEIVEGARVPERRS